MDKLIVQCSFLRLLWYLPASTHVARVALAIRFIYPSRLWIDQHDCRVRDPISNPGLRVCAVPMSNFDTSTGRDLESESDLYSVLPHSGQSVQQRPILLPPGDYDLEDHGYHDGSLEYPKNDTVTRAASNADREVWSFLNDPQFLASPADISARFERATEPLFDSDLQVFESGLDHVVARAAADPSPPFPARLINVSFAFLFFVQYINESSI